MKSIVVGMDLTPVDEALLTALKLLPKGEEELKVYLVHVMRDLTVPDSLAASFQKLFAPEQPLDERIKAEMAQTVEQLIGKAEVKHVSFQLDVIEGPPQKKLLEWVKVKNADLLVLGKKKTVTATGVVARRIASQSPCNTLFVPYNWQHQLKKILVPVDFSDNSRRALDEAFRWKKVDPNIQITALHLADYLPSGYYMSIKDQSRFNKLVQTAAQEAFHEFLRLGPFDVSQMEMAIVGEEDGNIAEHILEFANLRQMDAILIGAHGHSVLERFLFGSVTERLLNYAFRQMVFIVR